MHVSSTGRLLLIFTMLGGAAQTASPQTEANLANGGHLFESEPPAHPTSPVAAPAKAEPESRVVDLLAELPAGFSLRYRDTRSVEQQFNWYLRNPDYLDRVFTRAARYMPHIVEQLRLRRMPMELALLPVVESAFDPFAYSHGQAAGMWQFIPATGRRFGLEQNWWYDGRRDFIESTRAALDYLQRLNQIFDGDWLLAIAAYNSGEGKVRRAIRRVGPDATFWELRLPRETESYVPRLLALSRIVAAPADFSLSLPAIIDQKTFELVEIPGQIDLALAAQLAEVDIDTLYRFNPGLNRWATPPRGPHRLLLPFGHGEMFKHRLAELAPEQRLRWSRYKVRDGDSLSQIATRQKVTIDAIRAANNLNGSTIRAGEFLLIPNPSLDPSAYALSADSRLEAKLNSSAGAKRYTVQPGDSLWSIARRFGVATGQLARWNAMAPRDTLSIGRQLVIRQTGAAPLAQQAAAPPDSQRKINYVVRRGDSLASISSRFRVSMHQIKRWNRTVASQKYLYPGQKLVMYIDVRNQSGG